MDDGYIKFVCERVDDDLVIPTELLEELNSVREVLMGWGYLGMLPDGVGYGNISVRMGSEFIITGSATGAIPRLDAGHWVRIDSYSLERNSVRCTGRGDPSSESMSHAAIYDSAASANWVLHIHSRDLWGRHAFVLPTTPVADAYGTTALARSIKSLVSGIGEEGVIALGGHPEGMLLWAPDSARALALIQAL